MAPPFRTMSSVLLLLLAVLLSAAVPSVRAADNVVTISQGDVVGYDDTNYPAYSGWLGIPYAAAPVGNLRWAKPKPAPSWVGTPLDAKGWRNPCKQWVVSNGVGSWQGVEDCLNLNIVAPLGAQASSTKLPVWVWIHGGSWISGNNQLQPQQFVKDQNVIVVSVNYRLHGLGFWSSAALKRENADGASGNWGLLDQIAALKWIQQNIAAFGGDPAQVTIGGLSAGALSVCGLLASPLAEGLYRAAVMHSANCDSPIAWASEQVAFNWSQSAAVLSGCPMDSDGSGTQQLACLRALDYVNMPAMPPENTAGDNPSLFYPTGFHFAAWSAVLDGVYLSDTPLNMVRAGLNPNKGAPVLAGSVNGEGAGFDVLFQRMVPSVTVYPLRVGDIEPIVSHVFAGNASVQQRVLQAYPAWLYPDGLQRFNALFRDWFFACSTHSVMAELAKQGASTWHFEFAYIDSARNFPTHGRDVNFVFPYALPQSFIDFNSHSDLTIAIFMQAQWGGFLRTGIPSADWPTFARAGDGGEDRQTLIINFGGEVEQDFRRDKCDMWDALSRK